MYLINGTVIHSTHEITIIFRALTANRTARFVRPVTTSVPTGTQYGGRSTPAVPTPERAFGRAVPVGAADPGQRLGGARGGCPVADGHRRAAAAQAFQLVRFVGARHHRVAQLVLG